MDPVLIKSEGPIVQILFNRPEKKNALSLDMYKAISEVIESAEQDHTIRAIVITGNGGNFTSGHDISGFPRPRRNHRKPG